MGWPSDRASLALRLLSWMGAIAFHVLGAASMLIVWSAFLIMAWLDGGIPADDRFSFRWDNPFFRGSSSEPERAEEAVISLRPPKPRELPEMEKPRSIQGWDSRRLLFDENLGPPSPLDTRYGAKSDSGFHKVKGESLDFVSDKPFRGKGTYDTLGRGGGGGGNYGSKVVLKDAVQLGLLWLARHQNEDGSWDAAALGGRCGRALPNGREVKGPPCVSEGAGDIQRSTALAALAFAGAKYLPGAPDVWDGIRYDVVIARARSFIRRPPENARARSLALLSLSSLLRPTEASSAEAWGELASAVAADPPPAQGSVDAAWRALALLSARRADVDSSETLGSLPPLEAEAWPGESLEKSYLQLLGSYETSVIQGASLPTEKVLYPRLRAGQCRDSDTCREGSWEPVSGENRLSTTIFHLLALESLPGYGFRAGHPLRPSTDPEDRRRLEEEALLAERKRAEARRRIDSVRAVPGALRRGIGRVREAHRRKSLEEDRIAAAFEPVELRYVRLVPRLEIGDHLESDNGEEFSKFKPLSRLGGSRDLLTEEVREALREGEGIAGFGREGTLVVPDKSDDLTSLGKTLIFTLPDAEGDPAWTSYVVIGFAELP